MKADLEYAPPPPPPPPLPGLPPTLVPLPPPPMHSTMLFAEFQSAGTVHVVPLVKTTFFVTIY
jgi:hypothetical protein